MKIVTLPQLAHLHLELNHFPVIGTVIGFGLLLLAITKKSEELQRASFAVLFAIALVTFPVYMTGHAAHQVLMDRPGIPEDLINRHQAAALLGLIFMEVTGVVAWVGLWRTWRHLRSAGWTVGATVMLTTMTIVVMVVASNLGGQIRREELRDISAQTIPGGVFAPEWLSSKWWARFYNTKPWGWPGSQATHVVGVALLFGVVLVGSLRLMGVFRDISLSTIHRLLAWGVAAFAIQSITGMGFFVADSGQYTDNPAFHWKILLILIAGANLLYLTLFDDLWQPETDQVRTTAKLVGVSQIVLWIGIIFFGRMLPYLGNAF